MLVAFMIWPFAVETDLDEITIPELRTVIETLSKTEEKLDQRLVKTRENLKDFTFVLMDKVKEEKEKKLRDEEERQRLIEASKALAAAAEAEKKFVEGGGVGTPVEFQ